MKHVSSLIKYLLVCLFGLSSAHVLYADEHDEESAGGRIDSLLRDPNASISSIEASPFRRSRYFIGGGIGVTAPDKNRLVNGLNKSSDAVPLYKVVAGLDFSPRLVFYWEGNYHQFTDDTGFAAYTILTSKGSMRVNLFRDRGLVPYAKVAGGVSYTERNLSKQFSSSAKDVTIGEDATVILEFGFGLMYDPPVSWLANGDLRVLGEIASKRDNNDKATTVTFFQETIISLDLEFMFGSSVFQGDKIIIERDVTTDDGDGNDGFFREKRNPVLYPSAAELAALSDTSRPNVIFFQQYSSYLVDSQKPKLDAMIEQMQENPNLQATITGHADRNDFIYDKIERLRFNRSISARRAVAIRYYLVLKGIDAERITLLWRADQRPVTDSKDAVARSLNRRADVIIR